MSERMTDAALADALDDEARTLDIGGFSERAKLIRQAAAALRARAVPELYCVGRANYPARGGNVGLQWHVVGVADVPYRTCVPKNGELLFVLAASKAGGAGHG